MIDPVADFEHDHIALSDAVAQMTALLAAESSEDVVANLKLLRTLDALRDDLLLHFAKEEEGLFPFLVSALPDLAPAVAALLAGHDVVCGCLVRLAHVVNTIPVLRREAYLPLVNRFERAYEEHARAEIMLLRGVRERLDPAQRSELGALVRSL